MSSVFGFSYVCPILDLNSLSTLDKFSILWVSCNIFLYLCKTAFNCLLSFFIFWISCKLIVFSNLICEDSEFATSTSFFKSSNYKFWYRLCISVDSLFSSNNVLFIFFWVSYLSSCNIVFCLNSFIVILWFFIMASCSLSFSINFL